MIRRELAKYGGSSEIYFEEFEDARPGKGGIGGSLPAGQTMIFASPQV